MQRFAGPFGCDELLGASAYGRSHVQRVESRHSKLYGYLVGVPHDSIGVRRPASNSAKELKIEFRLVGLSIEKRFRQHFEADKLA